MSAVQTSEQTFQKIGKAVEHLMSRLKGRSRGKSKYLFQTVADPNNKEYFQIAERADNGGQWPDGTNWKTHHGPTKKQLEILEATSQSMDELVDRIEKFVMEGVDTTRQVAPQTAVSPYNDDAINKLVAAKVEALLADRLGVAAIARGKQTVAEAVENKDFEALPKPVKYGDKRTKQYGEGKKISARQMQEVKDRCDILGIPHDKIHRNGSGKINAIWLKQFEVKWAMYCARQAPSKEVVTEQVRREAAEAATNAATGA